MDTQKQKQLKSQNDATFTHREIKKKSNVELLESVIEGVSKKALSLIDTIEKIESIFKIKSTGIAMSYDPSKLDSSIFKDMYCKSLSTEDILLNINRRLKKIADAL